MSAFAIATLLVFAFAEAQSACGQTFKVLHTFTGNGDGTHPSGMVRAPDGSLYGTTGGGGAFNFGTVFRLTKANKEVILHSFTGGDGLGPEGGFVPDESGSLYGTTYAGGTPEGGECDHGCGAVFKVDKAGKETVLWAFTGGTDGSSPTAGVIRDKAGNLYGTTLQGGDLSSNGGSGCGVVFKVDAEGKETVLYAFHGDDGCQPDGGLVRDQAGKFYTTTSEVGTGYGNGNVVKIDKDGKETVLYNFSSGSDGGYPFGGLALDQAGNLYGSTVLGGELSCGGSGQGCGVVFKVDQVGNETVLHTFLGYSTDGAFPNGVLRDSEGRLSGTTEQGGSSDNCGRDVGCGTVFQVSAAGKETLLYSFTAGSDSADPSWLIQGAPGELYGTTWGGVGVGARYGVVFKLIP